jgi:3-phenylpropionate/cinnamic acid dioxygenase small subunit
MPSMELQHEIEQFYYRETLLLDRGRLHEWRELFTPDGRYTVSARQVGSAGVEQLSKEDEAPLADDDYEFLATRLERLDTGLVHAMQPPSRIRRFITNVLIIAERPDELEVISNLLLFHARHEDSERFFVGQREDRLRRVGGGWRIAARKVMLDHVLLSGLLTFFV